MRYVYDDFITYLFVNVKHLIRLPTRPYFNCRIAAVCAFLNRGQ